MNFPRAYKRTKSNYNGSLNLKKKKNRRKEKLEFITRLNAVTGNQVNFEHFLYFRDLFAFLCTIFPKYINVRSRFVTNDTVQKKRTKNTTKKSKYLNLFHFYNLVHFLYFCELSTSVNFPRTYKRTKPNYHGSVNKKRIGNAI